ncbi:MAG TPA: M67 family peptidase [Bacteroidetes bacterium]|nr:M67 family peptidase [Bacteroidota bacterium]
MGQYKITLSGEAQTAIVRHGEQAFPFECCGFLYGHENDGRFVTEAMPVANNKKGDRRKQFEISPPDYMKAEKYALGNGLQLLGAYHSHPNHPAIASAHDLALAMPYFSYVIVSVKNGKAADIKSWRLKETIEKKFAEEKVAVKHMAMFSD